MQIQFYIYAGLLGLTSIYGLVSYKRLTSPFKLLSLLILYTFLSESTGRVLLHYGQNNNFSLYHLNALVAMTFSTIIYIRLVTFNKTLKSLIVFFSLILILLALANTLFYQNISMFPSISISLHSFQVIALSLLVYLEMIKVPSVNPLRNQPLFWFNSGNFFFYNICFIGFVFFNEYILYENSVTWLFYINWFANLILYAFYLWALHLNTRVTNAK